jgi:hypothetical protein
MVDSGATNNIMSLSIMEVVGLECTKYYEASESIYAIDSRKVPTYGEIKDFCAWISSAPHIKTMFTIIVVDLPTTYGVVLGREWCFPLGGYIMNDGSCMMLPNKEGGLTKVLREQRSHVSFKKKEMEAMENYIDSGLGNYAILSKEDIEVKRNDSPPFKGFWKMFFDGASSKFRARAGVVFKNLKEDCILMHLDCNLNVQTMKQSTKHWYKD